MRILFDNVLLDSTLSATAVNANYPLSNLKSSRLKKIFKSTATTESITVVFPASQGVDCCYIGFTNATSASVKLYNSSDTLITTKTVNVSTNGGVFATVANVKKAVVELSSSSVVYVGAIGIGKTYTMPNPHNNVIKGMLDNSTINESDDGQYSINKIAVRKTLSLDFHVVGIDAYNEIYYLFSLVDRPVWVDVYEELNNGINPFYSLVTFDADSQSWYKYSFKVKVTEAR